MSWQSSLSRDRLLIRQQMRHMAQMTLIWSINHSTSTITSKPRLCTACLSTPILTISMSKNTTFKLYNDLSNLSKRENGWSVSLRQSPLTTRPILHHRLARKTLISSLTRISLSTKLRKNKLKDEHISKVVASSSSATLELIMIWLTSWSQTALIRRQLKIKQVRFKTSAARLKKICKKPRSTSTLDAKSNLAKNGELLKIW